jgi:aminoglycoside 2''-phosphotransferase
VTEPQDLITRHYPQLPVYKATPIQTGWDSFVLEIDNRYMFRFPRRLEVKPNIEKELCLLPELEKNLPLAVPHFEFIWWDDPQPENCFVGYQKIPGTPLTKPLLESKLVRRQLSEFLSSLHAFPPWRAASLRVPVFSPSEWRQSYADFYAWIKDSLYPRLDKETQARTSRLWEEFLDTAGNFQFKPVLIHSDLDDEHILCSSSRRLINGIIDWEDAVVGDPALDFTGLFITGGLEAVESILSGYRGQADETFFQRILFYASIVPFHEIKFGLLTNDANHLQRGINTLCST